MLTFIDSFTPPTCPSVMPEKTRVYTPGISKIKGKINPKPPENSKTKQTKNPPTIQIKKKTKNPKNKPKNQNQTYQILYPSPERRNGVQAELFRNFFPLTCNIAAVRWIRGATWATGTSSSTRGEDLSPQPSHGTERPHPTALQGNTGNAARAGVGWGRSGLPLAPARGPSYFCCVHGELGVPRRWTGTLAWLRYLHLLIATSRCLHPPRSLQGETAAGCDSTCAVLVTLQAAISSPVAMETTRPQHQLAVQYIIYLFFFT